MAHASRASWLRIFYGFLMSTSTTSAPSGGPCASTCPSSLQATLTRVSKGAKVENGHHWKLLLPALQCRGLRLGTVPFEDQEAWAGVNAVAVSRCHIPTVSGTTKKHGARVRFRSADKSHHYEQWQHLQSVRAARLRTTRLRARSYRLEHSRGWRQRAS